MAYLQTDTPEGKAALVEHSITRLKERYGIEIDEAEYWRLCREFTGRPTLPRQLVFRQDNSDYGEVMVHYKMLYRGQWVVVVWNASRRQIATFNPNKPRCLQ